MKSSATYPYQVKMPGRFWTSSTEYRYGFQGEYAEIDSETGFNHFTLRDYDARIGRWTKVDPYNQFFSPYVGTGAGPYIPPHHTTVTTPVENDNQTGYHGKVSVGAERQGGDPNYLDNALKFEGAPYLSGGMTKDGIDCSGLVNLATGNETRVWTTSMGNPPGNWTKINVRISSYDNFIADVKNGDLFVWPTIHTAFYAGDGGLFHAHGNAGTPTGYTYDLKTYWIPKQGYPDVYRQLNIR